MVLVPGRPHSIDELAQEDKYRFDPRQPLMFYLRQADQLRRQAAVYKEEDDAERAFICLVSCAKIYTEHIPYRHPEYNLLQGAARKKFKDDGQAVLADLSDLKGPLHDRYTNWKNANPDWDPSRASQQPEPKQRPPALQPQPIPATIASQRPKPSSQPARQPSLDEYGLIDQVIKRTAPTGSGSQGMPSSLRPAVESTGGVTYMPKNNSSSSLLSSFTNYPSTTSSSSRQSSGSSRQNSGSSGQDYYPSALQTSAPFPSSNYSYSERSSPVEQTQRSSALPSSLAYPTIFPRGRDSLYNDQYAQASQRDSGSSQGRRDERDQLSQDLQRWNPLGWDDRPPSRPSSVARAPSRLTRTHQEEQGYTPSSTHRERAYSDSRSYSRDFQYPSVAPVRPADVPVASSREERPISASAGHRLADYPPVRKSSYSKPRPPIQTRKASVREECSPEEVAFLKSLGTAYTEGHVPLRNIVCPIDLSSIFVACAMENTDKGMETCGILFGRLMYNTFKITNLLIPQQTATADTCSMTHEEQVFQYGDDRNLLQIGWIHTHPTQTCFMSSLDLHTHATYQMMLPESIAIVVAPTKEPSVGVFRLTDPPGLETVMTCTERGAFHPHPRGIDIYTDSDKEYGHVHLVRDLEVEVHDLR